MWFSSSVTFPNPCALTNDIFIFNSSEGTPQRWLKMLIIGVNSTLLPFNIKNILCNDFSQSSLASYTTISQFQIF